jgi:hypothetical protein
MKHGVPQQPIRFGLITPAISFTPGDNVGIQTHSYGLLLWPFNGNVNQHNYLLSVPMMVSSRKAGCRHRRERRNGSDRHTVDMCLIIVSFPSAVVLSIKARNG